MEGQRGEKESRKKIERGAGQKRGLRGCALVGKTGRGGRFNRGGGGEGECPRENREGGEQITPNFV